MAIYSYQFAPAPANLQEPAKPPTDRDPQIREQLQGLEDELAFQRESVKLLYDRLNPVLSSDLGELKGDKFCAQPGDKFCAQPPDSLCPMAAAINRLRIVVRSNSASINEIFIRLEL